MSEEWNEVFFAPIYKDGTYGAIGHIRYKGEPINNCGRITYEDEVTDITVVGRAVIPCKDCKYWVEDGWCAENSADPYEYPERDAYDFCSRGERRLFRK